MPPELIVGALLGLTGGVHCAGMCGGFVIAHSQMKAASRPLARQVAYYSGKTLTYVVFGVAAGAAGAAVSGLLREFQAVLSIVVGAMLVGVGVWLLGWLRFTRARIALPGLMRLGAIFGTLIRIGSAPSAFALGLLNGLLPCGLVYAVLASAAATGSPLRGALVMLVFGLSTIPALALTSGAARLARPLWRTRVARVGGVVMVLLGIMTMWRGLPHAGPHLDSPSESVPQTEHHDRRFAG